MSMQHPSDEILSAYLDRQLDPAQQNQVATHVAACAACQETLAAYRAIGARLQQLAEAGPTIDIAADVMARIDDSRVRRRVSWQFAGAMAAALLLILTATFALRPFTARLASANPPVVYVANFGSDDVSAVNAARNELLAAIPVAPRPWGLALSNDHNQLYVSTAAGIDIIDTRANRVVVRIEGMFTQAKLATSRDGHWLFAARQTLPVGTLAILDLKAKAVVAEVPVGPTPFQVYPTRDGRWLYVLNQGNGTISLVDLEQRAVAKTIDLRATAGSVTDSPTAMADSPDGTKLYVVQPTIHQAWVIETATGEARGTLLEARNYWTDANERGVAVSPDGKWLYVATEGATAGGISILDTSTFAEIAHQLEPGGYYSLAVSPDGRRVYATQRNLAQLAVLDSRTLQKLSAVPVGDNPARLVYRP